jgi:tRNA A37 threonylcarbamoyltransferase TsaD
MTATKKDPYDKTSTQRSSRMAASIRDAGGAAFTVRFKTAAELAELDALVVAGIGTSRNDVLLKLVSAKAKEVMK